MDAPRSEARGTRQTGALARSRLLEMIAAGVRIRRTLTLNSFRPCQHEGLTLVGRRNEHFTTNIVSHRKRFISLNFFALVRKMSECFGQGEQLLEQERPSSREPAPWALPLWATEKLMNAFKHGLAAIQKCCKEGEALLPRDCPDSTCSKGYFTIRNS